MISELKRQLTGDEGRKKAAYRCSEGYWTIGVGRLIDKRKGGGLRDSEIDFLLMNDIEDRINALHDVLPWFQHLDDVRKGVLLNMSFQMGVDGLLGFHTTLRLVRERNYEAAADQMLESLWAKQTPERAQRLSDQMRDGKWRYAPGV
jgi:lysozyme